MSKAASAGQRDFYEQKIPGDFNRMLDEQRALGAPGRRLYEEMAAVNGTIRVEIRGDPGARFALNISDGRMTTSDRPEHASFLTLIQDDAAFRWLEEQTQGSFAALLGALAGLGTEMKLTRKRLIDLEAVAGLIRLEVTGENGFTLASHFGSGPRPAAPDATIRICAGAYAAMRAGQLDPQSAFLDGKIDVEGDLEKVMQLAFAAVAPD